LAIAKEFCFELEGMLSFEWIYNNSSIFLEYTKDNRQYKADLGSRMHISASVLHNGMPRAAVSIISDQWTSPSHLLHPKQKDETAHNNGLTSEVTTPVIGDPPGSPSLPRLLEPSCIVALSALRFAALFCISLPICAVPQPRTPPHSLV
jgi:hypothetical protein